MTVARKIGLALAVPAVALLLSACGDDEEQVATLPATTTPTTAPAPPAPPASTQPAATTPPKAKTPPAAAEPAPAPSGSCRAEAPITGLKFQGIACDEATAVAAAWNRDQDRCNTIDDPSSPEGYNRTCTVEDYTCRAKRDTGSDARSIACAKGPGQIRFTWAP